MLDYTKRLVVCYKTMILPYINITRTQLKLYVTLGCPETNDSITKLTSQEPGRI